MKRLRWLVSGGFTLCVAGFVTGCGGVSGSHSVSPASMFLPGLMKYEAPAPVLPGDAVHDRQKDADSDCDVVAG